MKANLKAKRAEYEARPDVKAKRAIRESKACRSSVVSSLFSCARVGWPGGVLKYVFVGQRKSGDWRDPVTPRRDFSSERENHSNLDAMGSS